MCSEQIVPMAAGSSVYAPGVTRGKQQQHIQRKSMEWDEGPFTLSLYMELSFLQARFWKHQVSWIVQVLSLNSNQNSF